MRKMRLGKKREKPYTKTESIFEMQIRPRHEALNISKTFIHTKPVKYLLK